PLLDDTTIRPVVGMAPDAKIITVADMGFDGIIFALEGYDGVPMTGDEANIVSSSMSSSTVYVSGLDFASNFMDWLVTTYSGGTSSIVVTAGDNGPGYGTVSSPGSAYGVITAGLATDLSYRAIAEVYEDGPQAMFGDVVAISGRGPTVAGNPKPDIVAAGAYFGFVSQPLYMPDATPLAPYNNLVELWMYGQGLTSAVASAGVALVYQAYGLGHAGNMPQGSTVHEILMSGADDLSFDIFSQGAGQLNASKAVDIAYNSDGVSVSPFNWVPGDFQGVRYETYVKLVSAETPSEYLSETFTVYNHGSSSEDVTVQPEILSKIGEVVTTVTTTVANPHENLIINETGLYYRDGRILQLMDPSIWNDAELLRVTAYNENDTGYWLELFAWNDTNENGMADQDKDPDPYPGAVAWGERNRMQMSTIYTNKHEVTVQHPADRVGDGILIWIRSTGGPAYDCKWVVKAEAYAKGTWDMISVDDSLLTIPGKSSGTFTATVDRAKALAAGPGTYDGAISVGGALIPVVINVPMIPGAEELEPTTYSVTDEVAETFYNSTRTVTNETSVSKAKASNMTFYLKHRNIIQLSKVVYNGTNNQWYELPTNKYSVNLATGLVTLTLTPTDIKTDASFHTWYTYTEADVALAHSNIIPGSMTVYKDGILTSQYGSVSGALIFKNRNDFVGEELVNATGGETAANLANSGATELISGVTVYLNGTAMWLGTDYTVNTTTGAVAFMAPLKPGMLVTADYYTYNPSITTLMLPNTEISPGRKDISNPNGYLIYIDGVAVNDLVVTVNLVTGELTFTDPVPPGAIITADYKYGSYLPDYSLGVIDFVIQPALGVNITADYDYYYSEHPYVHGYMYGGCDGSGTGKGGDWRFYYTTLANGPLNRDPNNKMAIDMSWVRAGTDIDSFLFTDTYLSTPSVGNGEFDVSRYGPNLLTNSGGSTESSALFTASGGASDFALVPPTPGLNVLALHNVRFNGTMDLEAPTGKLGRMTISQDNIDIVTNTLAGEKTIYAYSSLEWDGMLSGVAAGPSAPTQYKDMLVYQDEDDWTLFETFEEQLASGNTSIYLTLKDCLIFDVHIYGHTDTYTREGSFNDVGDLDLGIFLDENGDGITQTEEFFAMCADADADEQVKLVGPPDGNYIIRVFGFTLKSVPAHYDIDITNVQGLGFGVEGEGVDLTPDNPDQWKSATPQPAFTQSSLTLSYNLASAKDGITLQGALYLGPGEAPYAMLMPIELRYDSIAPEVNSVAPLDGTTMKATQPTVTVGFADSMGEIVDDDARLFLDGEDVTTRTSISIEFVDDDAAPVKGYPQGTMTFIPTSPLSEGLHTVVATMGDLAGNVKSVSWSFVVDSSAP
ncbi:MAG: S8 family serine peptidase, partial [Thermoplasmata archaeon]|nr:S8 family serine peptidase [Thermoplasmata archaeon]